MDSIYPDALDGYSQLPLIVDGVTGIDASNINAMRSAIVAIEKELGIVPKGDYADVAARLTALESAGDVSDEIDALETSVAALETDVAALEASKGTVTGAQANMLVGFADGTGRALEGSGIVYNDAGDVFIPNDLTVTNNTILSNTLTANSTSQFNDSVTINLNNAAKELLVNGGTFRTGNRRNYGSRGVAPTAPDPSPVHGDTYFDITLSTEMYWDNPRNAWLSIETFSFAFGRNGTVPQGGFFRGVDGKAMAGNIGELALHNGMITQINLTRDAPPSTPWTTYYSVLADGGLIAELQISGAGPSGNVVSNGQFNAGQTLSVQVNGVSPNEAHGGTMGKVYYKWRK